MSIISETELRRILRQLGASSTSSGATAVRNGDTWEYSEEVLYLAYASGITNASSSGIITNQSDATGFQYTAFSASGVLLPWRGYSFSKSIYSSGDPTDYIWENITASGTSTLVRFYSTHSGLLTDMGDPDYPGTRPDGTDVPWTSIAVTSAIPDTAFFVAERYTINNTESAWNVYAVATEETGFGLIPHTITGRNKPALNSTQWNTDTIAAVTAYTGRTYSVIRELGYGTTVVITYDDGKLYGTLKKVSGVASWVAPIDFIDGDLLVDSTIIAGKIADNAVTTAKILDDAIDNDKIAANAVNTTQIAAGAVTATEIQANTIGANQIAVNSLTAGTIAANAITTSELAAGAVTATEIAADAVTANKVAANAIVADNIVSNAITADKINANAVTGVKISSSTTITAGTGNNVGVLDGADATYRIYAGHATPASAPFRVKQDGTVIIESASSGSRLVIEDDTIKVYDGSTLRVKLGNLA